MATPPGRKTLVRLPLGTGDVTATRYAELPAKDRVTFLEHYVRKGETLGHIARRYRVSLSLLRDANGESIWLIARRYGISRRELQEWNGLKGSLIKVGQRLRVAPPA